MQVDLGSGVLLAVAFAVAVWLGCAWFCWQQARERGASVIFSERPPHSGLPWMRIASARQALAGRAPERPPRKPGVTFHSTPARTPTPNVLSPPLLVRLPGLAEYDRKAPSPSALNICMAIMGPKPKEKAP